MEEEEKITQPDIQAVAPEQMAQQAVAPVVAVAQPVANHTDDSMAKLEERYSELSSKLGEISGKLDALSIKAPEPLAASVREHEGAGDTEHVAGELGDATSDAVNLTVDEHSKQAPKPQPQNREKRGLRRR